MNFDVCHRILLLMTKHLINVTNGRLPIILMSAVTYP